MLPQITLESPLAQAVTAVIQPKLMEMGWSEGPDSPVIEYIVLMLVNGKTQEQFANELSNDFLGLDEGDTAALDFSQWLFGQVEQLNQQINGAPSNDTAMAQPIQSPEGFDASGQAMAQPFGNASGQDAEMGDAGSDSVPTGPKAMRDGRGGKGRMLNQINRNLNRGSDAALHRVRGNGNGRIGNNNRGQRGGFNQHGRGGRMGMQGNMGPNNMTQMSPENQMQLMTMLEEQARMMSQLMPGFVPPAVNPAFQNGQNGQNGQGRSLFDRVERNGQRGGKRAFNKPRGADSDVNMEGEQEQNTPEGVCKFNMRCSRSDCSLAHQSPAAPEGTSIDPSDTCSFGAACKNKKCTGRHPSPAVRTAHQAEAMCRFFPNCTNPNCHFKHPSMPVCRNGSDCKAEGCKFTHIEIACKFNPCLNPGCHYKHAEGQRSSFPDKVWTPRSGEHLSERKFVADIDGPEELIKPEIAPEENAGQEMTA